MNKLQLLTVMAFLVSCVTSCTSCRCTWLLSCKQQHECGYFSITRPRAVVNEALLKLHCCRFKSEQLRNAHNSHMHYVLQDSIYQVCTLKTLHWIYPDCSDIFIVSNILINIIFKYQNKWHCLSVHTFIFSYFLVCYFSSSIISSL